MDFAGILSQFLKSLLALTLDIRDDGMNFENSLILFGVILQKQRLEIRIVLGIKEGANSKQTSCIGESGESHLPLHPRKLNADEHGHRVALHFLLVYHINLLSPAFRDTRRQAHKNTRFQQQTLHIHPQPVKL